MEINEEKQKILQYDGDTLVIANPGTGKTLLLAHQYAKLLRKGVQPSDILCLTFTKKATKEMGERIVKILKEEGKEIDYANLNVFTFHAYALDAIGREETIPANLLRYSIYRYFKDNETLRYGDDYLIDTIVPRMENLIRYLKSFGIRPQDIDISKIKPQLSEYKKLSKEEMDKFAECFVDIYRHYEEVKKEKGIDYADMLLEFLNLRNKPKFKYVLVDELQDVNTIEADIALESGETFFAVGDKKQAIFGFQGGSIVNFAKFARAKSFVLSENFRSTTAILDYAREYLVSKTVDLQHKEELKNLHNPVKPDGPKPVVYDVPDENAMAAICQLTNQLTKENKKVAIIARTNSQIMKLSKELLKHGIEHSTTYFSASKDARMHTIMFLQGILSNDLNDVRNSMFTPFFPISVQDAFELSELEEKEFTFNRIFEKSPEFKKIRDEVKTIENINSLFTNRILPVAVAYGKEYLLATLAIHKSFNETMSVLDKISFREVINYLKASDTMADESDIEKQVVLTTVHKAKGRQFQTVIYVPKKTRDTNNFQDEIVKAILKTNGIDAEEELNEEAIRIGFVALTRAKQELHIIPDKMEEYLNEYCERKSMELGGVASSDRNERLKRAYTLFLNGNYDKSKELLTEKKVWVREFISKYFGGLDHISFSSLQTDPCDYLRYKILDLYEYSPSKSIGSEVHVVAESLVKSEQYETSEKLKPYEENIKKILEQIRIQYPESTLPEQRINVPLEKLIGAGVGMNFVGFMDAIFKNEDSYLIVDWKTDKDDSWGSEHRQQLDAYRHAYSISNNIPLEKINVAIAYIGMRPIVNLGKIECKLDLTQPSKSAFGTFTKKVNKILEWKTNPDLFIQALIEKDCEDLICKSIIEEYEKELDKNS